MDDYKTESCCALCSTTRYTCNNVSAGLMTHFTRLLLVGVVNTTLDYMMNGLRESTLHL